MKFRALTLLRRVYNVTRMLHPAKYRAAKRFESDRTQATALMNQRFRDASLPGVGFQRVLVDGMWDNPNYWTRLCIIRAALGLHASEEVGLLGRFSRTRVARTFDALGIKRVIDTKPLTAPKRYRRDARELLRAMKEPDDLLKLNLPEGVPSVLLYDAILKLQRSAVVDLHHPGLVDWLAEGLACIEAAKVILDEASPELVLVSHTVNMSWGALIWVALGRGIPVVALYGDYGTVRFIGMYEQSDLFRYPSRPEPGDYALPDAETMELLARTGNQYLANRLTGRADDIGARFAYHRSDQSVTREKICRDLEWDPRKPIIGVYASNWFDYPHCFGMEEYRDLKDWLDVTIDGAESASDFNWLFKAHPCDDWYGVNPKLKMDWLILERKRHHLRVASKSWNGRDLIEALDAIITPHGTIGLEGTYLGKPVLAANKNWYMHGGFTVTAKNREDYRRLIATRWWESVTTEQIRKCCVAAGFYWGSPNWLQGYLYRDDSDQEAIYSTLPKFLDRYWSEISQELALVRQWMNDRERFYQIYKMRNCASYPPYLPSSK